MFNLSFLFPFFLLLSLCRAFNFRYVCVLSRDFVCYSQHLTILPTQRLADLLTPRTEGLTLSVQVSLFRLVTDYTYASAAEAQGIRVLFHDAVLTPLYFVHYKRLKYGEPRCSSTSSTKRCSSSHKRARIANRCSSCRRKSTAEIPLRLPAERFAGFVFSYLTEAHLLWLKSFGASSPKTIYSGCRRKRDFFCCFFFITLLFLLFYFFILSRALFWLLP